MKMDIGPCGDVNSDGTINIIDALLITQYYVDLIPENFDEMAGDVNGDSVVKTSFYLKIQDTLFVL